MNVRVWLPAALAPFRSDVALPQARRGADMLMASATQPRPRVLLFLNSVGFLFWREGRDEGGVLNTVLRP